MAEDKFLLRPDLHPAFTDALFLENVSNAFVMSIGDDTHLNQVNYTYIQHRPRKWDVVTLQYERFQSTEV